MVLTANRPLDCPKCLADLRGDPVPEAELPRYSWQKYTSIAIAIYDLDNCYIERWRCPECRFEWLASPLAR